MKNVKQTILAITIGSLFVSGTATANELFDFTGYARAGISTTSDGGEQGCFGSGADGHYAGRLGDECETYMELGFGKGFELDGDKSVYVNSRLSYETAQGAQFNDYQSGTEPGSPSSASDIALREINVVANGYLDFAPEASIWAGKRFYKRRDVGLLDLFYLNNSGYGAGLENVSTGLGDFSAAWMVADQDAFAGKANASGFRVVQVNKLDLRLDNIELSDNAKLGLAMIYGSGDLNNSQDVAKEPSDSGFFLSAYADYSVFEGTHTAVIQYSNDAMADSAWSNASGSKVETYATWEGNLDHSLRFIAYGNQPISETLKFDYSLLYAQAETLSSVNVSEDKPYRLSMVISPYYQWDDVHATRLELGYSQQKESYNVEDQDLYKIMLVQEFSPQLTDTLTPMLRAYAGSFFGNVAENERGANNDGEDGNIRFGVQMTASW
ncbi:carbohydrate porin [Vibrio hippocampi]|uniref:Maltoporin n=1 Tax=Vibrio hippocampi TaxID=654686 RepID=A0ABN8DPE6_9VIBR|nr:carbohydrate porin [Vibrio hippocampi]CAH0530373.1 Maltoporin [Vibrio hippocampi]